MPAIAPGSLNSGAGIKQLNELLANQSYVGGDSVATAEDMACFAAIASFPDKARFPNAARWYRHISSLRKSQPLRAWGASTAAGTKAKANPKKALEFDVKPTPWVGDIHTMTKEPPALGMGGKNSTRKGGGQKGKYYITTAINYANGWPHMGHAYEAIVADCFARHHRLMGEDTYYLTGSDEHGQKIAEKASADGFTPIQSCDRYVEAFKALNQRLLISNDHYVRTTDKQHEAYAQDIWKKVKAKGDIYFANYEGWYCVREERYFTDTEAAESEFNDPVSGVPLEKRSEPSFFFKLSKFAGQLIEHIKSNDEFVQPAQFKGELLERLTQIELRDLSISRGTFSWGVPCPEEPVNGQSHVMYVWFDALTNYASAVYAGDKSNPLSRFWPADMHVIGKDINWFHSVIWPCMLMSAGLPLPKSVVVHGFVAGSDGRKMSKSLGNVVDAHDELDMVSADTFRWYICREARYGDDLKFSQDAMKLMHNADLCGNLGNLVNRAVALSGGAVPVLGKEKVGLPFDLKELKATTAKAFLEYRLSEGCDLAVAAGTATNKWITDLAPWNMKDEAQQAKRATCVRLLLEAVYVLAHFYGPFIPSACQAILKKLGVEPMAIPDLAEDFVNLKTGSTVASSTVLFATFDVSAPTTKPAAPVPEAKAKAAPAKEQAASAKEKAAPAKEKAAAPAKEKKGGAPAPVSDQPLFSKLDIRVGKVVDAWFHPEADRLFVEMIDVGDADGPRQIVSGLREHYTLEQFKGRKLLAVCNMKPSKLVKVDSYGMVLCAKGEGHKVELLDVPDGLEVGTRILPQGVASTFAPIEPNAVKKQKVWEAVAELFKTDKDRTALFDGTPIVAPSGQKIFAPTIADAPIG